MARGRARRDASALRAAALIVGLVSASAARGGTCAATRTGVVAALDERLELTLRSGVRLRLVGIEPPGPTPGDPDLDATTRDTLAAWLLDKAIDYLPAPDTADRWGRVPAIVFAAAEADAASPAPVSLGESLLAAGAARLRSEPAPAGCLVGWAAAEERARKSGLGLWRDSFYAILGTSDRGALAEHAGTNVIVEGRLAAVRADPGRTTLVLQVEGGHLNLTIVAGKRKAFAAAGLTARAHLGQRLRARGLLDLRFGPEIELRSPEDVDWIAPDPHATAAAPRAD